MKDDFDIKEHASACTRWNGVTSNALKAALIFAVLTFGAWWNSNPNNWLDHRIRLYQLALESSASSPGQVLLRYYSVEELKHRLAYLQELQLKRSLFHAPVVDLDFDINDLGVISGMTFLVLMSWLRMCLMREELCLRMAFARASTSGRLRPFYELATIGQIPLVLRRKGVSFFWKVVPAMTYALPLLVQTNLTFTDFRSYGARTLLYSARTSQAALVSIFSTVGLLVLTVSCVMGARRVDLLWLKAEKEVSNAEAYGTVLGKKDVANAAVEQTETARGAVPPLIS